MSTNERKLVLLMVCRILYPQTVKKWQKAGCLEKELTKKVSSFRMEVNWLKTKGLFPEEATEIAWRNTL